MQQSYVKAWKYKCTNNLILACSGIYHNHNSVVIVSLIVLFGSRDLCLKMCQAMFLVGIFINEHPEFSVFQILLLTLH